MSQHKKKKKKKVHQQQKIDNHSKDQYVKKNTSLFKVTEDQWRTIGLIPIVLIASIVPLFMYAKIIVLTPLEKLNWVGGSFHIDFFNWYKSRIFIFLILISFTITLVLLLTKKIPFRKSKILIPIAIYSIFVIISSIFAIDKTVALRGFLDMHQGMYVLLGYMALIFTIYQLVDHKKHTIMLLSGLIFTGLFTGILGFYQYIGKDPFQSDALIRLLMDKDLEPIIENIRYVFSEYQIYATMGNSNFVGSFAALMIPLSFSLYFYAKKIIYKLFFFIFASLMIFIGFGSNSRAGIIGVFVSLILILILYRKEFIVKPLTSIFPFAVLGLMGLVLNFMTDGIIMNEFKSLNLINEIKEIEEANETKIRFEKFMTDGHRLIIETEIDGLIIEKKYADISFYDLEGNPLEANIDDTLVTVDLEGYENYEINLDSSKSFFVLKVHGKVFTVYHMQDGLRLVGKNGERVEAIEVDRLEFLDGYESLFSSRVYIWSISIPILEKTFFVGDGPDNFPLSFEQNDFLGIANGYFQNIITDKPHNMYIQTGVNTGVVSLFCLLYVFAFYIIKSFKLYLNNFKNTFSYYVGSGLFLSVVAYLVSGFFNDQVMSLAPLFYISLGLGMIINMKHEA